MIRINGFEPTVPLDRVLRHVFPVVPSLPYDYALDRARQKYIYMARRTGALRCLDVLNLQQKVKDYYFCVPKGYEVTYVEWLRAPDMYIGLPQRSMEYAGRGYRFYVNGNKGIVLSYPPSKDISNGIEVELALVPKSDVQVIPEVLEVEHGNTIAQGVLGDALRIPNKPWTDIAAANDYRREFNRGVMDVGNMADAGRAKGSVSMRFQRWV